MRIAPWGWSTRFYRLWLVPVTSLTSSLTLLSPFQQHFLPCSFLNTPSPLLPQGLCTCRPPMLGMIFPLSTGLASLHPLVPCLNVLLREILLRLAIQKYRLLLSASIILCPFPILFFIITFIPYLKTICWFISGLPCSQNVSSISVKLYVLKREEARRWESWEKQNRTTGRLWGLLRSVTMNLRTVTF